MGQLPQQVISGGAGLDLIVSERYGFLQLVAVHSGRSWFSSEAISAWFRVRTDNEWHGPRLAASTAKVTVSETHLGWDELVLETAVEGNPLSARLRIRRYGCAPVLEQHLSIRNGGSSTIRLTGVDTIAYAIELGKDPFVSGFSSAWGKEFSPFEERIDHPVVVETVSGRSSHGKHPVVAYGDGGSGGAFVVAPMWSGNWVCRGEPNEKGHVVVTGGLSDREFWYDLEPGASFEAPGVAMSIERTSPGAVGPAALADVGHRHWYPRRPEGRPVPMEWNHWFPYTDTEISDSTFFENVDAAAELGFELCTLDAGWFGPSEKDSNWKDWRGDWHLVNKARFPGGLAPLGDRCRDRRVGFGIWCEIEGLGPRATLDGRRAQFEARRDGEPLGYVCFGCPEARAWATDVIGSLVASTGCTWIKLDFNLDPGLGCDRQDHGHGGGSGLYAHVNGYYDFLDAIRARHPQVVLENCSSGGLRIDLGMLCHLHVTYLSDLDWLDHSLQIFWGVTAMLAPRACLKFSFSEWGGSHADRAAGLHQGYNPRDPAIPLEESDTYLRAAMMHNFAVSQRLPELPGQVAERFREHAIVYRDVVRPFVEGGQLIRLTPQPLREGGERLAAFQLSLAGQDRHLLFVFRLDGDVSDPTVRPAALREGSCYRVSSLFPGEFKEEVREGAELDASGIDASAVEARRSLLLLVEPAGR